MNDDDDCILLDSTETKEDTDLMLEFMRKNEHRLVESIGGAPLSSLSWNYQSRVTSATISDPPLSWAEQAAQNQWGRCKKSPRNSRWIIKTDTVSCTLKEDNPFQGPSLPHKTFGQPKLTLGNWYFKRYQVLLPNDSFECRNNGDAPHLLKWTCTFTCPLTANTFTSGQYVGADSTRFSTSTDRDGCLIVWFHTKKEAEHAAAARALDCLNFMEKELGQSSVEYYNYCIELPEVPSIPYPAKTNRQTSGSSDDLKESLTNDTTNTIMADVVEHGFNDLKITTSVSLPTKKHLGFTPKQQLAQWYTSRYKVTLRRDSFICRNNANPKQQFLKWTCTFICPLTKNAFKSGKLQIEKNNGGEEEPMKDDDDVWLSSKKEAEHAAAARALDCLVFMDQNVESNKSDPNLKNIVEHHYYCQEKPTIPPIPFPLNVIPSGGRMAENECKESLDGYRKARIDG